MFGSNEVRARNIRPAKKPLVRMKTADERVTEERLRICALMDELSVHTICGVPYVLGREHQALVDELRGRK